MYAALVKSAVAAGLVTAGALAPSQEAPKPLVQVVQASCAQSSYTPAPAEVRAACEAPYTGYITPAP